MAVAPPPETGNSGLIPTLSIVMPAYQAAGYIRGALSAVLAQETSVLYEVIVVDSSTDGTDHIVRTDFPQVRLLHFPERCQVGRARNHGADAARGSVILFVDSDTIPCPNWADLMFRAIHEDGADAVGGSMSNGTPWSWTGSAGFYLEFFRFVASAGPPRPATFLVGGNSGFRRELLKERRYADLSVGEDMYFSAGLAARGKRLLFLPRASVAHQNRTGFSVVMGYQRRIGQGAYFYRSRTSPRALRILRTVPALAYLIPLLVLPRIAGVLLRRSPFADFLRYLAVFPICVIGNLIWASGLHQAILTAEEAGK